MLYILQFFKVFLSIKAVLCSYVRKSIVLTLSEGSLFSSIMRIKAKIDKIVMDQIVRKMMLKISYRKSLIDDTIE